MGFWCNGKLLFVADLSRKLGAGFLTAAPGWRVKICRCAVFLVLLGQINMRHFQILLPQQLFPITLLSFLAQLATLPKEGHKWGPPRPSKAQQVYLENCSYVSLHISVLPSSPYSASIKKKKAQWISPFLITSSYSSSAEGYCVFLPRSKWDSSVSRKECVQSSACVLDLFVEPGDAGDKIYKELEQILNFSPFAACHFQRSSWFSWAKEGLGS